MAPRLFAALLSAVVAAGASGAPAPTQIFDQRQRAFQQIESRELASDAPSTSAASKICAAYDRLLRPYQSARELAALRTADVRSAYEGARNAQFHCDTPQYVADVEQGLAELRRRHATSQSQYIDLERAYLDGRFFKRARLLARTHPGSAVRRFHSSKGDVLLRIP